MARWPSGLRWCLKAAFSSGAWVQIPLVSFFLDENLVLAKRSYHHFPIYESYSRFSLEQSMDWSLSTVSIAIHVINVTLLRLIISIEFFKMFFQEGWDLLEFNDIHTKHVLHIGICENSSSIIGVLQLIGFDIGPTVIHTIKIIVKVLPNDARTIVLQLH